MSKDSDRGDVPRGWPPEGGGPVKMPNVSPAAKQWIGIGALVLVVLIGIALLVTGQGGLVEIGDTEVAVVVNYVTGDMTVRSEPGYVVFIPWLNGAFKFDRSPNEFVMEGDRNRNENHVKRLMVRANDGSNFWFEKLSIQYRLKPMTADVVLEDSGPGDAFKHHWVRAFARSVLRDEFGRFSAEEVTIPTRSSQAKDEARRRLNETLGAHGIEILEIITPKPKFDAEYETAIEDRKQANQEVDRLKARLDQLEQYEKRRLAEVQRDKETKFKEIQGTLNADLIQAERRKIEVEQTAVAYKIEQSNVGLAAEQRMTLEAEGLAERARKEAEGLRARVAALAEKGDILVREALAQMLSGVQFKIVPYRRDPAPIRIEHIESSRREAGGSQ